MGERILSPKEISALLDRERYGFEDDVYGSCPCGVNRPHSHPVVDDLARTALAAIAVARRLADEWMPTLDGTRWVRMNDDATEWIAEPMTDAEAALWAAITEETNDG